MLVFVVLWFWWVCVSCFFMLFIIFFIFFSIVVCDVELCGMMMKIIIFMVEVLSVGICLFFLLIFCFLLFEIVSSVVFVFIIFDLVFLLCCCFLLLCENFEMVGFIDFEDIFFELLRSSIDDSFDWVMIDWYDFL